MPFTLKESKLLSIVSYTRPEGGLRDAMIVIDVSLCCRPLFEPTYKLLARIRLESEALKTTVLGRQNNDYMVGAGAAISGLGRAQIIFAVIASDRRIIINANQVTLCNVADKE